MGKGIMPHQTGSFTGLSDTTIFTQQWFPDRPPRAMVVLVHGIVEHSGRYAHLAAYLNARGYALCALDHRGHGQSGGPRAHVDYFEDFVADLETYFDQVRAAQPGLPIFMYGHSMGSLIGLLFAFRHQDELAGLITSGTALHIAGINGPLVALMKGTARAMPHLRLVPLDPRGVSHDPAVVQRYRDDPLIWHGRMSMRLLAELVRAAGECERQVSTLHIPYLVLHGGADPLCLPSAAEFIRDQDGSPDKTVKIYEGLYHEVHNEPEQEQVFSDMVSWLDAHLPKA